MKLRRFLRDERAQASLEYILLLIILVVTIVAVSKNILGPFYKQAAAGISKAIQNAFKGEALHQFPIGKP